MTYTARKRRFFGYGWLLTALFCIGFLSLSAMVGCHFSLKTPSRDLYSYNAIPEKWEPIVREVITDPERQENIMMRIRIMAESLKHLEIESQNIQRDYLETLACYECDMIDFKPLLERIKQTEESSTRILLDTLDDLRESMTEEEFKLLLKRKMKS